MRNTNKLSVALATYNEEKNIGRCLEAIKDLAQEIIVVDGQSTDKTAAIARTFGAKVIITSNKSMFHINKQMAIDKAKGEWILQLDADEVVDDKLKEGIKKIINSRPSADNDLNAAFYIPRKNYFLGHWLKKGGQYPDHLIRFFKKGKAYLPCKSVHEQMKVNGQTGYLKGHLIHYIAPNFSRYFKNADRYTTLTAIELKSKKTPVNFITVFKYIIWLPLKTFIMIFIRHKGFIDGIYGFIFSLFSGLHFSFAFIKYLRMEK